MRSRNTKMRLPFKSQCKNLLPNDGAKRRFPIHHPKANALERNGAIKARNPRTYILSINSKCMLHIINGKRMS